MNNKKIYYSVLIVLLLILVLSTTYAFFAPHAGGTTSSNATVTSNTTDLLTFSINRDISFTVTQALFAENGENQSGDATATATLIPNNKTGVATMNYYLYLNIESNPIVYSEENTDGDPELMLQVFDGNNQLVTLTGLGTQKTIKGVTGYDITSLQGPIVLLDSHAISASNNQVTIENWRVVITLINLDVNQNDNTGKTLEAEILMQKEMLTAPTTFLSYRFNNSLLGNNRSIHPLNSTEVYCAYEWEYGSSNECDYGSYYLSLEDCEADISEKGYDGVYACDYETRNFTGIGSYETSENQILSYSDVYLKTQVVDSKEYSSEICIHYDDLTACLDVEDYSDIEGALADVFGNENVDCSDNNCIISDDDSYYCSQYGNNTIKCQADSHVCILNIESNINGGSICEDLDYPEYYYHDYQLAYGANDNSRRYVGSNPNNFICFGSDSPTCPATNLYRIIGQIPVNVILDDSDPNNVVKEQQSLYKLIKYNYATSAELGLNSSRKVNKYDTGDIPDEDIDAFCYSGDSNRGLSWEDSLLNTYGLNTNFIGTFDFDWQDLIAKVDWQISSADRYTIFTGRPAYVVYQNELEKDYGWYAAKVGLMYVSDYSYAAPFHYWYTTNPQNYNQTVDDNWLYRGVGELTISSQGNNYVFTITAQVNETVSHNQDFGVRPVFYLSEDAEIDFNHTGNKLDPFRIDID